MANKGVIKSILLVDFDHKVFLVEVIHKNKGFSQCLGECWWGSLRSSMNYWAFISWHYARARSKKGSALN